MKIPSSSFSAISASRLDINATKPQLAFRAFSSSVLGHIILTLAKRPYFPKRFIKSCSTVFKNEANFYLKK